MSRKPRGARATNHGDFAGPDADKDNLDRLAAAAAEENAKRAGHNGGEPLDEVIRRNANAIEVCLIEIDTALRVVQKARADLGAARKTAKTDMGSKEWVDAVVSSVKLKRQAAKGGASSIVSEHRMMGRVLRLLDTPLGVQYNLFAMPTEAEVKADPVKLEAEATMAGEAAGRSGQPVDNCPHNPGTPEAFGWRNGWQVGVDAVTTEMSRNAGTGGPQLA